MQRIGYSVSLCNRSTCRFESICGLALRVFQKVLCTLEPGMTATCAHRVAVIRHQAVGVRMRMSRSLLVMLIHSFRSYSKTCESRKHTNLMLHQILVLTNTVLTYCTGTNLSYDRNDRWHLEGRRIADRHRIPCSTDDTQMCPSSPFGCVGEICERSPCFTAAAVSCACHAHGRLPLRAAVFHVAADAAIAEQRTIAVCTARTYQFGGIHVQPTQFCNAHHC